MRNYRHRVCVSWSVISDSLQPHGVQPARLLWPWNSPGKNTWVGSHSLFQGVFLTQRLNLCFLHCRQIVYQLSHQWSPKRDEEFSKNDFFLIFVFIIEETERNQRHSWRISLLERAEKKNKEYGYSFFFFFLLLVTGKMEGGNLKHFSHKSLHFHSIIHAKIICYDWQVEIA